MDLGSIRALVDISGNTVQSYNYSSFGETKVFNSSGVEINPTAMIENPYAYTAREWDHETNSYFYRARYYDPKIGRFISEDSIGFEGGDTNLYRYVKNTSISYTDPSGKILFAPIIAGGLIGGISNALVAHFAGQDVGRAFLSGFISGASTAVGGFAISFLGGAGLEFYKQMMDSDRCNYNWNDIAWSGLQSGLLNKFAKTLGVAKGMSVGSQKQLYNLTISMQSFFSSTIGSFLDISKNTLGL